MINETYTANVALCGHFHSYLEILFNIHIYYCTLIMIIRKTFILIECM